MTLNITPPITVALADDHQLLRESLALLINSFPNCRVPYSVGNGQELIAKIAQEGPPDILVLDMSMPQMDGHQTALRLQQHHPSVKILMLTMHNTDVALVRLLRAGVKGFLQKDISPAELQRAITEVATTGFYFGGSAVGKMASFFNKLGHDSEQVDKMILTEREERFLILCATELTYKEIAQEMGLSPSVIDNIRDGLFGKAGTNGRVGLALFAVKHGMVTL
jgi:two-component system, NarL family, invasion response regulator UvrY